MKSTNKADCNYGNGNTMKMNDDHDDGSWIWIGLMVMDYGLCYGLDYETGPCMDMW